MVATILDIKQAHDLLSRIAETDSDLAAALSLLVDDLNFQAIQNLLDVKR